MRTLVVITLVGLGLAGCFASKAASAPTQDGDGGVATPPPTNGECASADQCTLAAASCCECPSFAVSVYGTGQFGQCRDVMCPAPECPANIEASCVANQCVVACAKVACETTCANGFATDASGCLTCTCAGPPDRGGCSVDTDCVRVPADCCGCEHGGTETAVLASDAGAYSDSLGCSSSSQCPSVNTCEPDAMARCIQGRCDLSTLSAAPGNACGRPDLPACPVGQPCIINADPATTMLGVGACGTP